MCHSRDRYYDDIDDDDPFNPQARRIAAYIPPRGPLHSFCSYSSSLDSQTSLQPPAQTVSNAPVSEYMYGRLPASPQRQAQGGWVRVQRAERGPLTAAVGRWQEGPQGHLVT